MNNEDYQKIINFYRATLNEIDSILSVKIQEYAKMIQNEQNTAQMYKLLANDIAFLSNCKDKIHKVNNSIEENSLQTEQNLNKNSTKNRNQKFTIKYNSITIEENVSQRKLAFCVYKYLIGNKILSEKDYQPFLGIGIEKNKFNRKFESKIGDILTKEQMQELIQTKNNAKRKEIPDYDAENDFYLQRYEYDELTKLYYSKEWDKESIDNFIYFMEQNYNIQIQINNKFNDIPYKINKNQEYNRRPNTLHEAMKLVLEEQADKKMPVKELAKEINARQLYIKKDNSLISYSQLYARANHHRELFNKIEDGIIKLIDSSANFEC